MVFDVDHDFEGPRGPKAHLGTVNRNLSHHLGRPFNDIRPDSWVSRAHDFSSGTLAARVHMWLFIPCHRPKLGNKNKTGLGSRCSDIPAWTALSALPAFRRLDQCLIGWFAVPVLIIGGGAALLYADKGAWALLVASRPPSSLSRRCYFPLRRNSTRTQRTTTHE